MHYTGVANGNAIFNILLPDIWKKIIFSVRWVIIIVNMWQENKNYFHGLLNIMKLLAFLLILDEYLQINKMGKCICRVDVKMHALPAGPNFGHIPNGK